MTHDDGRDIMDEPLDPDALRAQDAVRALPGVAADPEFRARLGAAFASGAIDPAAATPAERPIAARRPGSRLLRLALATAALLLVAGFAWVFNPGPRWRVAALQNAHGNVLINDEAIPADDFESINEALVAGATIEWNGSGDLELVSRGQVALGIAPGTRMTLPAPPPRWFGRHSEGRVEAGEVRLTSGTRFHGATLTIATPQASATMTGTTLAVIEEPMGTCVCVLEGTVHVMAGRHDMGMVPAGQLQQVFADGRAPHRGEMRPTERMKLGMMRAAMAPVLEQPRRD